jgi:metal-responsive CopG/Arc/MetJ family transcriptional regulator
LGEGKERTDPVRLSVVLDDELLEHVRLRAFEERMSKSAYVRDLVARDVNRRRSEQAVGEGAAQWS